MEADPSLFRPDVEYPLEMSLVGGTRGKQGLIINNSPNIELDDIGDIGPLLEISLLEEGVSAIFGSQWLAG